MVRAHILTPGFSTFGGAALLAPVNRFQDALRRVDVQVQAFATPRDDLFECDVLIVDRGFFAGVAREAIAADLERFRERASRLVWADTSESTALMDPWVLPYVDAYWKGQALKDRLLYLRPMYGGRYFTDYYHRYMGVEDASPRFSEPVEDVLQLPKIQVYWNAAFVDYTVPTPAWASPDRDSQEELETDIAHRFIKPSADRPIGVVARFGAEYAQPTLQYQRERIKEHIGREVPTERTDYATYLEELRNAKIVLAPFGSGEISTKDFEVLMSGAVLVKPVMNIVETWPPLYHEQTTYWPHNWRMEYLDFMLESMLDQYHKVLEVAWTGQDRLLNYTKGRRAAAFFAQRLRTLLTR